MKYPTFATDFALDRDKTSVYISAIERILSQVLPPNFFQGDDAAERFKGQLPLVSWGPLREPPFNLSFFLCCHFRLNAFRFFCELISKWVVPGKPLNVLLQFATDFLIPEFGGEKYICGEAIIHIETSKEYEILQKNLPIIESEISLGVQSAYQASRILEIKGLSADEKTALIQESIASLIRRRPQDFDYDLVSEMQHFLIHSSEQFKNPRSFRHISRIICIHYLFRKALKLSHEIYPERRYISVKLMRTFLTQKKSVLGIAIGISFLKDSELFERRHVISGIKAILPEAEKVKGSFFIHQAADQTCTLYLEIEKGDGTGITLDEERLLKELLPSELKSRIEQRLNPIFMPQNEEEVMRSIISLNQQLKYVRDLPQVVIDFNQQTAERLEFLVVLLRVIKEGCIPLEHSFKMRATHLEYIPDRTKVVGKIGKKHQKEASVFRLSVEKTPFLRKDHSVDLYKARSVVSSELSYVIGEFRDYNGGTISKETELFEQLKKEIGKEQIFQLENFFYSLMPPVTRSVLSVEVVKKLFTIFVESQHEGVGEEQNYQIRVEEDKKYFYSMIIAKDSSFREVLQPLLATCEGEIATCFVQNVPYPALGLLFHREVGKHLKYLLETAMGSWVERFLLLQN